MVEKTDKMIAEDTNSYREKTAVKNKTTVNIIGSCVSREIFNRKKGNEYEVKTYIHRNSLFTLFFDVPPHYIINQSEVSEVSPHDFTRRMMCTTLNSDGPEQLLARKGEWIVIDTYYSSQLCAMLKYPEGNNRLLQYDAYFAHYISETLKNNKKFKNCSFEPVDASVNMTYYIEEVARFLKENWGNKIILINLPLAFIELNEDGILQRDVTIQMDWQQRSNKMIELLINRVDCQYITIPAVAIRDYWLNMDHINVHYITEIYDYLKESVDSIINVGFLDSHIHNRIMAKYDIIIGNILLGNWASEKNTLARVDALIKGKTSIDSERTIADCFKLVEQNNPLGYGSIARLYREGKGVEKDLDKAIEWMRRASDCRIEWARIELFDLLWKRSKSGDLIEMKIVAEEHARKGNADSMLRLGRMYREGKGVEKDLSKAITIVKEAKDKNPWFTNEYIDTLSKSNNNHDLKEAFTIASEYANTDNSGAMGRLGRMYRDGKGVEKDLDKAIEWMRKAAERNPNWKNEFMYMLWKRGTLEDLRELNGNAEKGAAEGNAFALQWLGRMYRDGKGVEKDLDKAIDMMRKTAEKIQGWSRNELIDMLWKRGTPEDFAEMKDIAETAAGEGDIGAMSRLGRMYRDGKGVEKDLDKAIEWMRKAAESGNKWTVIEYVDTLWKRSSFQDLKRAIAILTPLGEREDAEAMERLGIAYRDGKGVEKNLDVAIKWMSKATITLPRLKNSLNEMLSTPSSYQDKNEPHNNH